MPKKSDTQTKPSKKKPSPKIQKIKAEDLLQALKSVVPHQEAKDSSPWLSKLAKFNIRSPLLLTGTQHVRSKLLINWIREQFFADTQASVATYFGPDLSTRQSVDNILQSLGNLSLFSQTQLVIVYEADKVKAAASKPLLESLEQSSGQTLVILTAQSASTKSPLISGLSKIGTLVEFTELKGTALKRWIQKEAQRSGACGIDSAAAELLIRCYGSDATTLSRELAKLSLLTEEGKNICQSLVEHVSKKAPEHTSFQLLGELSRKNAVSSVGLCGDLLRQGLHPLQVLAFLSKCFRTMLANKDIHEAEMPISSELSNPWFLRNLSPVMRCFSADELKQALKLLKDLDFQLKGSRLNEELVLSLAIQRLALRGF